MPRIPAAPEFQKLVRAGTPVKLPTIVSMRSTFFNFLPTAAVAFLHGTTLAQTGGGAALDAGSSVTPLHLAAESGDPEVVRARLQSGDAVEDVTSAGLPLYIGRQSPDTRRRPGCSWTGARIRTPGRRAR